MLSPSIEDMLPLKTSTSGHAAVADARPDSEKAADVKLTLPEKVRSQCNPEDE